MEETHKIRAVEQDTAAGPRTDNLEESENCRVLKHPSGDGDLDGNTSADKGPQAVVTPIGKLVVPSPLPTQVQTTLLGNAVTISIFNEVWDLKDHTCKHVLNPYERWHQIDTSLDAGDISTRLIGQGCYSHHLKSVHNSHCKHCPLLSDESCDTTILPAVRVYTTSITRILQNNSVNLLCVQYDTDNVVFLDEYGILVICKSVLPLEYVVETAFRDDIRTQKRTPTVAEYFEQGKKKVFNKFLPKGKIIVRRI